MRWWLIILLYPPQGDGRLTLISFPSEAACRAHPVPSPAKRLCLPDKSVVIDHNRLVPPTR